MSELTRDWGIRPNGVLHVGAHLGEEASDYEQYGWNPVIWIEAQPSLVQKLKSKLDPTLNSVIEAAVWDIDNVDLKLNVASNSMSSSLLEFGSHSESYPEIKYVDEIHVQTKRLDSIISANDMPNFINIDIQGAELPAIRGLGKLLDQVNYIFVEVNRREVYKNCTIVRNLDSFLSENDFKRVTTRWYYKQGWGDALYIRRNKIQKRLFFQVIRSDYRSIIFYSKQILRALRINKLLRHSKVFSTVKDN